MAKILLVEDDNNLREIYEARLQAEGYDIVSAPDGEAALVVAKKELPDLVISDVMMPRISGFEMLDIMRNTEGLKQVKVIMLTALGQAEDKTRADALGADKYLVKSQVTLEDIVKSAAELLGGDTAAPAPTTPSTAAAAAEAPTATATVPVAVAPAPAMPVAEPPQAAPEPMAVAPAPAPVVPVAAPPAPAPTPVTPAPAPAPEPVAPAAPAVPDLTAPAPTPPAAPAVPAPAPAAPTVAPTAPTAPIDNAAVTDGQLMNDAVKDLINGAATEEKPATKPADLLPPSAAPAPTPAAGPAPLPEPPAPAVPTTPDLTAAVSPTPPAPAVPDLTAPAVPAPTPPAVPDLTAPTPPTPVPIAPAPTPEPSADTASGEDGRTKRVIQPLGADATSVPTPDLNELMAKEGHALDAVAPHDPVLPHQPGHVISPNPVSATGQPEDPNKISL